MSEIFGTLSLDTSAFFDYQISQQITSESLENTEIAHVRLGQLKGIKIHNFKSFEGLHYVGPFTRFTCVIGPNGGGKSNVLDAIQFVFGMSIRSMRCRSYEELLYSKSIYIQQNNQVDQEAQVELLFDAYNYIETQIGVKRILKQNGLTKVTVGDVVLQEKEFGKFLLMSKIIVPSRNFIMLQGDTDYLATIEPKKLTEIIEIVSGSIQYKNTCQTIQNELNQVLMRMRDYQLQKGMLRTEQKKVKELKQTGEKYRKLQDEINELKQKQKLIELKQVDDMIKETKDIITEYQEIQYDQTKENKQIIEQIQFVESIILKYRQELKQIDEAEKQFKKMEGTNEFDNNQIDVEIELLNKQIQNLQQINNKTKKEQAVSQELLVEIELDIEEKKQQLEQLNKSQYQELPRKQLEEFQELQNQFKIENQQKQSEISKLQQKQSVYFKVSDQIEEEIRDAQNELKDTQQEKDEILASNSYIESELQALQEKHDILMKRLEELQRQNLIDQQEIKQLLTIRNEKEKELHLLEVQETENIDEKQTQLLIQQLKQMFKDFKGELSSLCYPESQQFAIPLKVALSQRLLCALVVDSENTTKQINKHLKSLDIVKEIIVISRLKKKPNESNLRERVEQFIQSYRKTNKTARAYLAIDIIKYEDYLEKPLSKLLQGILICDSYNVAVQLQKAQIPEVKQIITFDGLTIAQSGMIVFNGTQQRLASLRNFKQNNQKFNAKLSKETRETLLKSIEDIKDKIKTLKQVNVIDELKQQSALKLRLEEQKVQLLGKQRTNSQKLEEIEYRESGKLQEMNKLKQEYQLRQNQLNEIDQELNDLQDSLKEQQKIAYKQFAKKYKLNEVQLMEIDQKQHNDQKIEIKQMQLNKLILQQQSEQQQQQQMQKKIDEINDQIYLKKEVIQKFESRKQNIKQNYKQSSNDVKELSGKEHQINNQIKIEQKKLKQLVDNREKQVRLGVDRKQAVNMATRKLENLNYQKIQIIEQCEIESIPVRKNKSQFQASYNFDEDQQADQFEIDYEIIKNDLKEKDFQKLLLLITKSLEQKDQEIAKYLSENLQIGLMGGKTDEKFFQIEKSIEQLTTKIKELLTKEVELNEQLTNTRKIRKQKFEQLFDRVEKELRMFYQKLTENQNKIGGSIILYVENKDEPFEGGIIYTPNPPNKKYIFDNSEQLSGGEKTIASIALLLALNSAIESPFMLFDEVDAHLDQDNAFKLQSIVKTLSTQIQFILVSHNSDVFANAESLVGVTIQYQKTTSESFSLLL